MEFLQVHISQPTPTSLYPIHQPMQVTKPLPIPNDDIILLWVSHENGFKEWHDIILSPLIFFYSNPSS